jgi:endonuclease I
MAAVAALTFGIGTARSAVFLSELCDPKNNYQTDRFIEIYNSGPDAVDLTSWSVVAIANNVDVTTWTLSGSLAAGQAKVCGNTTTTTGFTVHFPSASWSTGYANWNGGNAGDGVRLKNASGTQIDYVYVTTATWTDADMVRKPAITGPNPVFTLAEWTITAVTLATDASPGTHNGSLPPAGGPRISDIVTIPSLPLAGAGVDVQASVVDTSGAIASVTLAWGLTSGSMPNNIAMAWLSDSTYRTGSQIPAQSAGATVYYGITAVGASASTTTTPSSYTLGGVGGAPVLVAVGQMSDSTLLAQFDEAVDPVSAETPGNYTVGALVGVAAVRDPIVTSQVLVTFRGLTAGTLTLTVNGVSDLSGNYAYGATRSFNYVNVSIPAGYYDSANGLKGSALRVALHNIIKNHTVKSYAYALTAFGTTDVKPNGKIWDVYSDIPGGTPPYEYAVGQTGQGGSEGLGYNREHSFPQSWFGGVSPPYSDLWILYPTDSYVNNMRSNNGYGEVGSATYTSLNGSRLGSSASAGYSGTVFEPIDPFKGDLARSQFYVATRYFNEDSGWPGGPESVGSQLLPWAANQYLTWSVNDPPSWKERMRNGAIYVIQNNRNPFVDHPEFAVMIYDSNAVVSVEPGADLPVDGIRLRPNVPNPFSASTTIAFELARPSQVTLRVFDLAGRQVRELARGAEMGPGTHAMPWDGRDDQGARLKAGLYFCRLEAGDASATRRMALIH